MPPDPAAERRGAAPGPSAASDRLGRYELLRRLGSGGMAEVHLARAAGLEGFQKLLVLKRILPHLAADPEFVRMFLAEARLAAILDHPNVVQVFDIGREGAEFFFTMEYVYGENLQTILRASRRKGTVLPIELAIAIAMGAATGLHYAHERVGFDGMPLGLVHRDVSPANLMVSERGEVKLLDFGIVKSEQRLTKTQAGMVKGNLFFMSPEQARALEVDFRSDLFSLGMVLTFVTLGRTLYMGDSLLELMNRAAAGPTPQDLDDVRAGAGPLATFLLKALATDPNSRFQTAGAMAQALAEAVPAAPAMALEALMRELFQDELESDRQRFSEKG